MTTIETAMLPIALSYEHSNNLLHLLNHWLQSNRHNQGALWGSAVTVGPSYQAIAEIREIVAAGVWASYDQHTGGLNGRKRFLDDRCDEIQAANAREANEVLANLNERLAMKPNETTQEYDS